MKKTTFQAALLLSSVFPMFVRANPEGASVVSGQASIERLDGQTTCIQTNEKTIIEWQDFSIGLGEKTTFIQPHKNAAVLNRVIGKQESTILGSLEANGRVYLINPNGILIGKQGVISAASFLGSTHSISNEDFLNQDALIFKGDGHGRLVNLGEIHATEGDLLLLGSEVEMHGLLRALKGEVFIGAGQEIILTPAEDDRMKIRLSPSSGTEAEMGIELGGKIESLSAHIQADGNLYGMAINQTGIIQALGVIEREGKVFLVVPQGDIQVQGHISAQNDHMRGGEVRILGENLSLLETAFIDVSGPSAGGVVLIGGDKQGKNPNILNSESAYVAREAQINASATEQGNGGKVIVWSNEKTTYLGSISARGGEHGGNGGLVEVSGKNLDFRGTADRNAPQGKAGMLLLDPFNVNITATPEFQEQFTTGTPSTYQPTASGANIDVNDLMNNLNSGDVTVLTTGFGGNEAGDIHILASIVSGAPHALVFDTSDTTLGSIYLNAKIVNLSNSDAGSITFKAAGNININAGIDVKGLADISLTAGGSINLAQTDSVDIIALNFHAIAGVDFTAGSNNTVISANYSAGGGRVIIAVDNAYPSAPNIGPGALNIGNQFSINTDPFSNTGALFIYSGKVSQNTIASANAAFNGQFYFPPPADEIGINTATNQWTTYYPTPFTAPPSTPYTFLYKEPVISPTPTPASGPTQLQTTTALAILTTATANNSSADTTIGWPTQISLFQPLSQPPIVIDISTYSAGFYIGPIQQPSVHFHSRTTFNE